MRSHASDVGHRDESVVGAESRRVIDVVRKDVIAIRVARIDESHRVSVAGACVKKRWILRLTEHHLSAEAVGAGKLPEKIGTEDAIVTAALHFAIAEQETREGAADRHSRATDDRQRAKVLARE